MQQLVGYARISTPGESFELQRQALDQAGVHHLFVDVASDAKAKLPQLKQALRQLGAGDILVVWRLDRLDRTGRSLIELIEDLGRQGIGFRSLEDHIDTTTGTSTPLSHLFAALAQSERDLARERSAPGRAAARACGRKGGRKPKLDEEQRAQVVMLYYSQGLPVDDLCARFQIAPRTLFRCLREANKRKPKARTAAAPFGDQRRMVGEDTPRTLDAP